MHDDDEEEEEEEEEPGLAWPGHLDFLEEGGGGRLGWMHSRGAKGRKKDWEKKLAAGCQLSWRGRGRGEGESKY